ncbi:MAG TPA: cob(I)yrinic acid a,c-diamide adenosyltransferase [Thermoanaerobaculia bacterium]|nr:cob(I)yrinic acid a,c-diamide adenosyltransferase [Thermoanaerobaculia bacterium]HQR66883.1 cob(I)yrinic acid a,c-diamide adenosyltransferase [Thermoanaerobaculia bacterium]
MAIRINRVYTRGGDRGETSLVGGRRVPKDSLRIESYGTVDELNAVLGLARTANRDTPGASKKDRSRLEALLTRLQNELFNLGSDLATLPADRHPRQPVIEARHVRRLEEEIDELNEGLPELRSFVLPGGGPVGALLHQARTVCRRAERCVTALARKEAVGQHVLAYLNRLSDLLFVLSRRAARMRGEAEALWDATRS